MAFKLITNPEFTHSVTIFVPADGGHEEQTLQARYRYVPTDDLPTMSGRAYVEAVLVSLDDVADEKGKPLPDSPELREAMLSLPWVVMGLMQGYNAALIKARLGN
jgi:hypothetical protein